jgi:threonine synthase
VTATAFALRCRICEHVEEPGPATDCPRCDGPTDVAYDLGALAGVVSRERIAAGPQTLWRYRDLLPAEIGDETSAAGWTPLVRAEQLSDALDVEVLVKIESANPTGSYKDRTAALAGAAAAALRLETLCCTSTGNLAEAVSAEAGARGMEAIVLAPHRGLGAGRAQTLGAQVVAIDGSYEQCRALERSLAGLYPWGFVTDNLSPYAVEGAKTVSFEIAEQLGWRMPSAVVCAVRSGALLAKVAQGFHELRAVGLVDEAPPRLYGAQATEAAPLAAAYAEDRPLSQGPWVDVDSGFADLAIGAARASGGGLVAVNDDRIEGYTELLTETTGIAVDCAGGAALGALVESVRSGRLRRGERVVLVVSGSIEPANQEWADSIPPIPAVLNRLLAELGAA